MRTLANERYVLHDLLGQGGTATVHRALDTAQGRWVALKLLSPDLSRTLSARRRFSREVATLRRLSHPHIVRLLDWGGDDPQRWLVMELIEGRPLSAWSSAHGPMPIRLAATATLQICAGVSAAHAAGVIHRDIKPANVLVAPDGRCRVADFGLAREPGEHDRLTRTGVTMGTYGFMAPEQSADAGRAGPAADVYSVGATMLALLNGRPHLDIRAALDAAGAQLPLPLARALVNATLPDPARRYATLEPLTHTLERALPLLPLLPPDTPDLHIPLGLPSLPTHPTLIDTSASVGATYTSPDEDDDLVHEWD